MLSNIWTLENIKTHRTSIMGCAIISVMLFHQPFLNHDVLHPVWKFFHHIGYWGVDIFLFLSGIGIYFSLEKNDLKTYYHNRIKRIAPSCLIMGGLSLPLYYLGVGSDTQWFGDAPMYTILTGLWYWYIEAILIFYLISPFFYLISHKFVFRFLAGGGGIILSLVYIICALLIEFDAFSSSKIFLVQRLSWIYPRLPVYLLGMVMASRNFKISKWAFYIIGGGTTILAFTYRYAAVNGIINDDRWLFLILSIAVPFICQIVSIFAAFVQRIHLSKFLNWCGSHSLELFLGHVLIFYAVRDYVKINVYIKFLLAFFLSFIFAALLKSITKQSSITKALVK